MEVIIIRRISLLLILFLWVVSSSSAQKNDYQYKCAVDYNDDIELTSQLDDLETVLVKIDSANYLRIVSAKSVEERTKIVDRVLKDLFESGNWPDTSTQIGKELGNVLKLNKSGTAMSAESLMIYETLLEELPPEFEDNVTVYRSTNIESTNLIIYGIINMDDIDKMCCIIKQIHDKNNTHPIGLTFYEKENFDTIHEGQRVTIAGRQEEKRIAHLVIK